MIAPVTILQQCLLNEKEVNRFRLDDWMKIIKVEPVVCATIHHYQKLSMRLQETYGRPYARNTSPPCG